MRYTLEELNAAHEHDLLVDGDLHFMKGLALTGSRHGAVTWLEGELGSRHPAVQTHAKAMPALTTGGDQFAFATRVTAYERRLRQREILAQIPGTVGAGGDTDTVFH